MHRRILSPVNSLLLCLLFFSTGLLAQVAINQDNSNPDPSAMLDVKSSDKGMLVPRMTTVQREAIASPATGLLVFDNDTSTFWYWTGSGWTELNTGNLSTLSDADGDTKILVEESPDEDVIRFDVSNVEVIEIVGIGTPAILETASSGSFYGATVPGWQSFTAPANAKIDSIEILYRTDGGTPTKNFKIYEGVGSGGTELASLGSFTLSTGWNTIPLPTSVDMSIGQLYTIWFSSYGGIRFSGANPYKDGRSNHGSLEDWAVRIHWTQISTFVNINAALDVNNTVTATAFVGDGSGLTNLPSSADNLGNHTANQNLKLGPYSLSGDGDPEGISVAANGNVGVNIGNPETILGIWDKVSFGYVGITQNKVAGLNSMELTTRGSDGQQATRLSLQGNESEADIAFYTGDQGSETTTLFIEGSNGNVGIGTNTPSKTLEVAGNAQLTRDDPVITFFDNSGSNGDRKSEIQTTMVSNLGSDGPEYQKMKFAVSNNGTGTNTVMTLQGDGNVGIGTTTPSSRLDVAGGNISLNDGWISNDGDNEGIVIGDDGRVGVGELPPDYTKFWVAEDVLFPYTVVGGFSSNTPGLTSLMVTGHTNSEIFRIHNSNLGSILFSVRGNGRVGIGIQNPNAPLHVQGTTNISSFSGSNNGGAWMKESSGAGSDEIDFANNAGSTAVSIYASGSIVADGEGVFVAATVNWSDERIKQIEGVSDASQDLETLNNIEITDYRRIDGGKREKKVIAQQLREVFPQAVSLREGVIPSIYEHIQNFSFDEAENLLTIETTKPHELKTGDRIDFYTETGKFDRQEVAAVLSENAFQVKAEVVPQELFVFGKWVNDVHTVDYDAIAMLNVSATQEQQRIIEAQQSQLEILKAQNAQLSADIKAIKTALALSSNAAFSSNNQ